MKNRRERCCKRKKAELKRKKQTGKIERRRDETCPGHGVATPRPNSSARSISDAAKNSKPSLHLPAPPHHRQAQNKPNAPLSCSALKRRKDEERNGKNKTEVRDEKEEPAPSPSHLAPHGVATAHHPSHHNHDATATSTRASFSVAADSSATPTCPAATCPGRVPPLLSSSAPPFLLNQAQTRALRARIASLPPHRRSAPASPLCPLPPPLPCLDSPLSS
ncbi:hypothetical protein M0R45_002134 [Rubus argutus]|uniref:Uncharacterized protein n=1 Tax=Rubus argutus TaxID=59490 RepID=A0AAW1VK45_RUBAR